MSDGKIRLRCKNSDLPSDQDVECGTATFKKGNSIRLQDEKGEEKWFIVTDAGCDWIEVEEVYI
jgi:hypothetical protein